MTSVVKKISCPTYNSILIKFRVAMETCSLIYYSCYLIVCRQSNQECLVTPVYLRNAILQQALILYKKEAWLSSDR
jgi:hypothetical protein